MPRRGGRRKKRRTEKEIEVSEREKLLTPRCFVLKRGTVGNRVRSLVDDFREVMMPNCARRLRESRINRLEDFVAVSGSLGVSHLVIFTASKRHTWMKLARLPQGPTLTFQVASFSLARDVRASQRRAQASSRDLTTAPLQVLNGFAAQSQAGMQQLTAEMLRGLFPPIDVPTFNQVECRRAALFNYDAEKEVVQFRHFTVGRRPVGLQRGVSKLLRPSRLPKLGRCGDVADFVLGGGVGASESEVEDLQEVPSTGSGRTAVRLVERGPRLTLLLVKAEEGVCNGSVLYHRFKARTPSQQEVNEEKARQRRKLKERNERLEAQAGSRKADHRAREKRKQAPQDGDDGGGEGEEETNAEGFVGAAAADAPPKKKQRFHPFAWGAKASRGKGEKKAATAQGGSEGGGQGKDKGGRRQRQQDRVLDRFHKSRKGASK